MATDHFDVGVLRSIALRVLGGTLNRDSCSLWGLFLGTTELYKGYRRPTYRVANDWDYGSILRGPS